MPLPDFHDRRPYTHPDHPGTWRISAIGPTSILMRNIADRTTIDTLAITWPGDWHRADVDKPPRDAGIDGAQNVAPGIYRLAEEHTIYAVPSTSTDRIHTVILNTRTGHMRCDGPRCYGRTCSHQKRVLEARAGF